MPEHIPFLRVFLSSPGDVNNERKAVLDTLERLPNRPAFREKVGFRVVAWDKPGADTPMLATLSPQEAIDAGLPKPSQCDIVVVILWTRMGTPFKLDGVDYLSGTHYELLDALAAKRPTTLIYRRTEGKLFEAGDHDGRAQYNQVQAFFDGELFYDPATRQIRRGVNTYSAPADFREKFETHLEELVVRLLARTPAPPEPAPPAPQGITFTSKLWVGSPFPGLRSFTPADAPIFFGRERETDALVKRVAESRFVAVIGASGSGKSSLVGAGLLPRLAANAISSATTGSKDWQVVQFKPGQAENPFAALFEAILTTFPALRPTPFEARRVKTGFVQDMLTDPATAADTLTAALDTTGAPAWAEALLFIDQFEELFTTAKPEFVGPFARMLTVLAVQPRIRVVATLRHDFMHRAGEIPELAALLNLAAFYLAAPTPGALATMVKRPAERAALVFDDGLPEHILSATDREAGALALLAYALDELYQMTERRRTTGAGAHGRAPLQITFADYETLGGVAGAIGARAEQTFAALPGDEAHKAALLARVFRQLVEVDERGTAARQRAPQNRFDAAEMVLIQAFTGARLLVLDAEFVEVAHEALFRSWERLKAWIASAQEDLILLRQVRYAAHDWATKGRPDYLRWPAERLALATAMRARLKPDLSETEQHFLEPEQERLYRELNDIRTTHQRRFAIGNRLADIGDTRPGIGVRPDGTPDIAWLPVIPGGTIAIEGQNFSVQPFYIAPYLVTYAQYQAFVNAPDGFNNQEWWQDFPEDYQRQAMASATNANANAPRDSLSWYQAVAFARWLNAKYREFELFEQLPAFTPNPSPQGEGLKDYREMAAKVMVDMARDLRQRQTSAEALLWECLRDRRLNGLKFRRQHPVANTTFVVDFFCHEYNLIVELDGGIHSDQQREDQWRQQALEDAGMTVISFTNEAVFNNLERVLIDIQRATEFPLASGRGGQGVRASDWQIRLPTEWEWQWAAQNGLEGRAYPWGAWDEHPRANTTEAGINDRSSAVGMYPHGAAACGALDLAGNLWEWCLNDYDNLEVIDGYRNEKRKVLRGGSFYRNRTHAAVSSRLNYNPNNGHLNYGCRVAACPISAL